MKHPPGAQNRKQSVPDGMSRTTGAAAGGKPLVVCDMSRASDTPAERTAEYRRLLTGFLIGREWAGAGFTFRFRADPGIADWVRDLARREKECCAFFDFTVTADDREVRWNVSVIDDDMAQRVMTEFYRLPDTFRRWRRGRTRRSGDLSQGGPA